MPAITVDDILVLPRALKFAARRYQDLRGIDFLPMPKGGGFPQSPAGIPLSSGRAGQLPVSVSPALRRQ